MRDSEKQDKRSQAKSGTQRSFACTAGKRWWAVGRGWGAEGHSVIRHNILLPKQHTQSHTLACMHTVVHKLKAFTCEQLRWVHSARCGNRTAANSSAEPGAGSQHSSSATASRLKVRGKSVVLPAGTRASPRCSFHFSFTYHLYRKTSPIP